MHCLDICLQARAGIEEVHFLPFSPENRRTAITYKDGDGKMHRVSKGAPEEVYKLNLSLTFTIALPTLPLNNIYMFCNYPKLFLVQILAMVHNESEIKIEVHSFIDEFAKRGLRSLGLAYQV